MVFLIAACNTNQPVSTTTTQSISEGSKGIFNAKSVPDPKATGLPLDMTKIGEPPPIPKNVKKTEDYESNRIKAPSFDHVPPYDPNNIVPGSVTVIFKNDSKIRFDKISKKITSKYNSHAKDLEDILTKEKFKNNFDLALEGETEERLDDIQKQVQKKSLTEIPNFKSIQYFQFGEKADTKAIAEKIRRLPFVRTAYPTSVAHSTTIIPYTKITPVGDTTNLKSSIKPNDSQFTTATNDELDKWWWFNRHKVFEGWKVYASEFGVTLDNQASQMANSYTTIQRPTIAVIDSGFDTYTGYTNNNRPSYLSGTAFLYDGTQITTPLSGQSNITGEYSNDYNATHYGYTYSHGAHVSSVLAAPLNSGTGSDLAGIIPGATILPIKLTSTVPSYDTSPLHHPFNSNSISKAIRYAADSSSNPDVISLSLAFGDSSTTDYPIIANPDVATSIFYATTGYDNLLSNPNSTWGTRDRNVVIAAGNSGKNLDTVLQTQNCPTTGLGSGNYPYNGNSSYPSCWDYGQIIVGSSRAYGYESGFNYGKLVDIVAGGYAISGTTYNLSTGSQIFSTTNGSSESTPMVSATVAMLRKIAQHKGITINSEQARDIVVFTGTLALSDIYQTTERFQGRGLHEKGTRNLPFNYMPTGYTPNNQYAQMRELNVFNALSFVKNYSNNCTMVRLFNNDDLIEATTDTWANHYGYEGYYTDTLFKFAAGSIPSGQVMAFDANNSGGNGSYGYQIYKNGYLSKEYIKGVVTMYKPWLGYPSFLSSPSYNTAGTNQTGWFVAQYYTF